MASFGLKVIRFGFAAAGRLAPGAGARLAYRLFCLTDSRKPKGEKQRQAYAAGRAILQSARQVRLSISAGSVMTHHFAHADRKVPRVLVVHGWGSQAPYLARMAKGLADAGLEVVLLDLPGHGLSSGRTLDIRRAVEAILAASRQYGGFDAIVGHSFGGAASLTAVSGMLACYPRVTTGKLVLIGAPSRLDFIFDGFARMIGLTPDLLRRLEAEAERSIGAHPDAFDGTLLAPRADIPVLVIHAEDDKEVPAEHARRYEGLSERIELVWANGLGHRRIVSDAGVIGLIAGWVSESAASADLKTALG